MQKLSLSILFIVLFVNALVAQSYLPTSKGEIVEHTYYSLSYCESHEQAEWVYYTLTPATLAGGAKRKDDFRVDPKVSTQSATLDDYRASGYDRGHLCPAASMSRSDDAISESFYMSNMSPQHPSFNRGTWKRLEEHVRELAMKDSLLHVVTGPLFADPIGTIGKNEVTIPSSYYKVIYSPKRGAMLGYVMSNCKLDGSLDSYVCSVDYIESISGLDFFADVDDELTKVESTIDLACWVSNVSVDSGSSVAVEVKPRDSNVGSGQCEARTASGSRCTRKAQSGSKFCWQHQPKK